MISGRKFIDIRDEKVFYNSIFTSRDGKVLQTTTPNHLLQIYKFGTLLDENNLRQSGQQYQRRITNIYDKIAHVDYNDRDNFRVHYNGENLKFEDITQKILYQLIIKEKHYKDHHSSAS